MWGYRTPEYIDFGRAAARFDDAANLVPARLTALAIIAVAVPEGRTGPALRIWWRDRASTPSPNAGHPMAAMAGATGTVLSKRGATGTALSKRGATGTALTNHDHKTLLYNLGAGFPPPTPADLRRGIRLARRAAWIVSGLVLAGPTLAGILRQRA